MANYKAVDMDWLDPKLTEMANSIRAKTGGTADLTFPDGFTEAIDFISVGGGDGGGGSGEIPDDYIKKSSTWNYTTTLKAGYFNRSSDTPISSMTINDIGFKPKVFYVRNFTSINSSSSRKYIVFSMFVVDNDYNFAEVKPNPSGEDVRTAHSTAMYYESSMYKTHQSNGSANILYPTDSGVEGKTDASSEFYFKASTNYYWIAWG